MGQTISNFATSSQVTTVASFVENTQLPDRCCVRCSHQPPPPQEKEILPEPAARLLRTLTCPYTTIHYGCSLTMPMVLGSWSERLQRWFDYGQVFGGEDRDAEILPICHLRRLGSDYLVFVDDNTTFRGEPTDRFHQQARKEILYATIFLLTQGYRILRLGIQSPLDDHQARILLNCLMAQNQRLVCYPKIDYSWLLNETI